MPLVPTGTVLQRAGGQNAGRSRRKENGRLGERAKIDGSQNLMQLLFGFCRSYRVRLSARLSVLEGSELDAGAGDGGGETHAT
jgi:hypothetical protein